MTQAVFTPNRDGTAVAFMTRMQIMNCPTVEARAWLRNVRNSSALATNRFGDTARALEFVESLYELGAPEVSVEDPAVDGDGLPYADTLLVVLPADDHAEWMLRKFCEREGPGEYPGDFTLHELNGRLRLWWD